MDPIAPRGERLRIGFFGRRNAGKSSLFNAFVDEDVSIVSNVAGTTTDLVSKSMELLPLGSVTMLDTPGFDDVGEIGEKRVSRARKAMNMCDIAILVASSSCGWGDAEQAALDDLAKKGIPCIVAWNKFDASDGEAPLLPAGAAELAVVSASSGYGIEELRDRVASAGERRLRVPTERKLVSDLVESGELVVMATPIDGSAPKGRIILPQQMAIRDCLDAHIACLACQPNELGNVLASLSRDPALVVTDSQAVRSVAAVIPERVPLTTFSVLMARYKGELEALVEGTRSLTGLRNGSRVLVVEGCSHRRKCEDIGTVKIPAWVRSCTRVEPEFCFMSGSDFPDELAGYDLVIHCGGCMLSEREMSRRVRMAEESRVPIVNYGAAIASMHGVLERCLRVFGDLPQAPNEAGLPS